ncbi:MAG: ligase-associated DNA damage response endonuclease PdeM [Bacteroidetes bacterium]|nr:ligase-associated DNA damage response endonuclease PdeM [Bacteroidota bacterium]MBS1633922.1 ligase-associated DNA damage response endonuclease PdeM [Bacteroidota bacterium]
MQQPLKHIIHKNTFWLSADRCMYWEEEKTLILADLHFGKTGHFRKSGIAIPQAVYKEDLQRLVNLIQHFQPKELIVVGDLFHSKANKELELFQKWRNDLASIKLQLVKGNHDILDEVWYQRAGIEVYQQELFIKDFSFVHDIKGSGIPSSHSKLYTFSGHIHPAIQLIGPGKQSFRFPCFYFTRKFAVLPAFSRFTGTHLIDPKKGEKVYAIADGKLIPVS